MNNLIKINSFEHFVKILSLNNEKIIILVVFIEKNIDIKKLFDILKKKSLENNNILITFIDIEKFEGQDKRLIGNVQLTPRVDIYYVGNLIMEKVFNDYRELEQIIKLAEDFYDSKKNNYTQNIDISNLYSDKKNPLLPQQNIYNQNLTPNNNINSNINQNLMPNNNINSNMNQNLISNLESNIDNSNNLVPTFHQMQQMFQIFQMMQQMGILNNNIKINDNENNNIIILPNGDKIIPLGDGKYGLIKDNK